MGKRTGKPRGRPKGTTGIPHRVNNQVSKVVKRAVAVALGDALDRLVTKSETTIEQVLDCSLPCSLCQGVGCTECKQTGLQALTATDRIRVALDLLTYGHSKKQTVDPANGGGGVTIQLVVATASRKDIMPANILDLVQRD
jgi:hypothetical protein